MRKILSIIFLFSFTGLAAQTLPGVNYAKPTSGPMVIYSTEQEAETADTEADNRYTTHLRDWTREGAKFSSRFTMPFAWANRQVLLDVDAASGAYAVRVNGTEIEENTVGALAGQFNISKAVREGQNTVEIEILSEQEFARLEDWKSSSEPFLGAVRVVAPPKMHIRDILTRTWRSDNATREAIAEVGIVVKSDALNTRTSHLYYTLESPLGERVFMGHQEVTLNLKGEDTLRFLARIPYPMMWSDRNPKRYTLRVKTQHEGRFVEFVKMEIGFCLVQQTDEGLMINGEKGEFKAATAKPTLTNREIDDLKLSGVNLLVMEPGAVRRGFYDYCDRVGMYVVAQVPIDTHLSGSSRRKGGNPSNDPAWQEEFVKRAEKAFHATKRHPSVIAFSMARESANGINLYETFLRLKCHNDPRPIIYTDGSGEWNSDKIFFKR